jgi:hydrogenase 3 maturation protease
VPGGSAPENFTGAIRRFSPDRVVMVDAVAAGLPAGQVIPLQPRDLGGISLSSHTMPLGILRDYLAGGGFTDQFVLGIQPACVDIGGRMSMKVRQASREIARALFRSLL